MTCQNGHLIINTLDMLSINRRVINTKSRNGRNRKVTSSRPIHTFTLKRHLKTITWSDGTDKVSNSLTWLEFMVGYTSVTPRLYQWTWLNEVYEYYNTTRGMVGCDILAYGRPGEFLNNNTLGSGFDSTPYRQRCYFTNNFSIHQEENMENVWSQHLVQASATDGVGYWSNYCCREIGYFKQELQHRNIIYDMQIWQTVWKTMDVGIWEMSSQVCILMMHVTHIKQ